MLSTGILAGAVALLLVTWWWAAREIRLGGDVPRPLRFTAAVIPGLLVAGVMLASWPRFGDLRVALEGVRFRFDSQGPQQIRVGGSAAQDHLVVRDLPPGFLTFQPTSGGLRLDIHPATSRASDDPDRGEASGTFAAVRIGGSKEAFHNSIRLTAGTVVLLPDGRRLTFDAERPAWGPKSQNFLALPSRTGAFGWRIGRELPPDQALYPLRYYGAPDPGRELLGPGGAPLGAFVWRGGGFFRRELFLTLTEPGLRVEQAGRPPVEFKPEVVTIPEGDDAVHVALFRVDDHRPSPAGQVSQGWEKALENPNSRAQDRRSFKAQYKGGVLCLVFDTPTYVRLARPDLDAFAKRSRQFAAPPVIALAGSRFQSQAAENQLLLELSALGEPMANELFSRIELPARDGHFRVTTHLGARRFALGEAFTVGDAGAAILRLSRLELPWGTFLLLAVVGLTATLCGLGLRRRLLPFVLLSGVETLLALRVLIAFQGAALNPAAASAVWESLGVCVGVPFLLQAALILYEERRVTREVALYGAVATTALGVVLWQAQDYSLLSAKEVWYELGADRKGWIAALGLPPLLAWGLGRWGLPLLDRLPLGSGTRQWRWSRHPLTWTVLLLVACRWGALFAFGFKERIDVGAPLAVSIYYTPWVLLAFALLWRHRDRRAAFLGLWLLLLLLYVVVPGVARDWGIALIFPLAPMLLFALPLGESWNGRHLLLALPLLSLLLNFLLPLVPAQRFTVDFAPARADRATAQDLLAQKVRADRNTLRLWSRFAPEVLQQVGTSESESLSVVVENLRDYASQGLFGRGYLGVPLAQPLAATHLDDNLSAVHVLGTFGILGGLSVLLLLAAWAVLPWSDPNLPVSLADWTPRTAWGLLLLWTLFAAGFYMISANVDLLLFTGKNVYFLAAASLSDAVEGTLLVLLGLWALENPRGVT